MKKCEFPGCEEVGSKWYDFNLCEHHKEIAKFISRIAYMVFNEYHWSAHIVIV